MSGPLVGAPTIRVMTQEAFNEWVRMVGIQAVWNNVQLFGKPRVRVSAPRQTPNEADL